LANGGSGHPFLYQHTTRTPLGPYCVRGRVLVGGELDGDEGIEDDGGEEDMGVEEKEKCGCSMNSSESDCKQRSLG
jgi:hypothetical protein